MEFKEHFSSLLIRRKVSISALAKGTGISKSVIHGWCNGQGNVSLKHLRLVSDFLKCPVHEICWGIPDPYESPSDEILKEIFSGDIRVTLHRIERKK